MSTQVLEDMFDGYVGRGDFCKVVDVVCSKFGFTFNDFVKPNDLIIEGDRLLYKSTFSSSEHHEDGVGGGREESFRLVRFADKKDTVITSECHSWSVTSDDSMEVGGSDAYRTSLNDKTDLFSSEVYRVLKNGFNPRKGSKFVSHDEFLEIFQEACKVSGYHLEPVGDVVRDQFNGKKRERLFFNAVSGNVIKYQLVNGYAFKKFVGSGAQESFESEIVRVLDNKKIIGNTGYATYDFYDENLKGTKIPHTSFGLDVCYNDNRRTRDDFGDIVYSMLMKVYQKNEGNFYDEVLKEYLKE